MMRSIFIPLALALSCLTSVPALASCKDELPKLKARINHEQVKENQIDALRHYNRAVQTTGENECRNETARIWQALRREPPPKKPPSPAEEEPPKPRVLPPIFIPR